ncbi:MAG: O-antigen ligase family protein [Nitrospiraceae bacterium]|nr:O-antigen ligase family protein [Nitrospiraceae bacterium]
MEGIRQAVREPISPIQSKVLWACIGTVLAFSVALAITEGTWIDSMLVLFAPLAVYLSLQRPFIFPVGFYVFSIPFENLLVMSGAQHGATVTRLLGAIAIAALAVKGMFEGKLRTPEKINLWWALFAFYCLLSMTWAISGRLSLVRAQTIIGLAGLYIVLSMYRVEKKEYESLMWFILAGGALASIFTIYAYHENLLDFGNAARVSLISLDSSKGVSGANKQAFDMLLPVSVCLGMLLKKGRPLVRAFFFLVLFMMFYGIVITGSRGGLAAVLAILIFFLLSARSRLKAAIIAAVTVAATLPMTSGFFLDRIRNSVSSHASGRTDIWHVGLKAMGKYWLFGAGLDCFPKAYTEFVRYSQVYMGLDRAPHNIFVGMFVELGIIGGLLMVVAMVRHYAAIGRLAGKFETDRIVLKAAFWAILVGGLSQDVVWYKSFWLLWMMIVIQKHVSEAGGDRLGPPGTGRAD